MSNLRISIPFLAAVFSSCFVLEIHAQNTPYIPYNPGNNTTNKVYTNEVKEPIGNNKDSDTIVLMKNTISFHPTFLIDGTVALGYERVLNKRKHASRVVLGYSKLQSVSLYESAVKDIEQLYVELNYKFFLSRRNKKAPVGLYASPFFQLRHASFDYKKEVVTQYASYYNNYTSISDKIGYENLQAYSIAGGVMLGYSAIVLEMVTLEAYMGIGQQSVNGDNIIKYKDSEFEPFQNGFFWNNGPLFKLGCSIGVNF